VLGFERGEAGGEEEHGFIVWVRNDEEQVVVSKSFVLNKIGGSEKAKGKRGEREGKLNQHFRLAKTRSDFYIT
jgi:hypothetical protein